MPIVDGRQQGRTLAEIRRDHVARYEFARGLVPCLGAWVLDCACGVGYGSAILADAGASVTGVDVSPAAIDYARAHWHRPATQHRNATTYVLCDARDLPDAITGAEFWDLAVSFETLEHMPRADALGVLTVLRRNCDQLVCSVPNEDRMPFASGRFPDHHRHYTADEFEALLAEGGWAVDQWWTQTRGERDDLAPGRDGDHLVAVCRPA